MSVTRSSCDPFAVFGASSSDEDDEDKEAEVVASRDPENGIMAFHSGTEQALVAFVRNGLSREKDGEQRAETVSQLIDRFCYTRHWMMHAGPQKAETVRDFIAQSLDCHEPERRGTGNPFVIVEIGTYCGYSCMKLVRRVLAWQQQRQQQTDNKSCPQQLLFHLFTVDINPKSIAVAKELVALACLDSYVTFVNLHSEKERLPTVLRGAIQKVFPHKAHFSIDFLFLDHDKNLYLDDLLLLEQAGMIRAGTFVAADNVVVFSLDKYREHMMDLANRQVVETRLVEGMLEYCSNTKAEQQLQDGIGKLR